MSDQVTSGSAADDVPTRRVLPKEMHNLRSLAPGVLVFGRYKLKALVGRGGMGVVWRARDETLDTDVALKFLPESVAHDPAAVNDLKRETRRSLQLTHPNIVRIFDFVQDEQAAAISMEYVEGATLTQHRLDHPQQVFEPADLNKWVKQLCEALDYAHTKAKVVHRDLKPSNLMVDAQGDLKVTDFGISATLTDSSTRVSKVTGSSGTPVYMSPQQMLGKKPAPTDDIYSVGATLYELLTGKPPFHSGHIQLQVMQKMPPSITPRRQELGVTGGPVPLAWEQTILACLAKEPANRPQNVPEVAERLGLQPPGAGSKGRGATTPEEEGRVAPAGPGMETDRPRPESKMAVYTALALLVFASLGGWYYLGRHLPAQRAAEAERLRLANARGGLMVATEPAGAEVRVGGTVVEKTPLTLKEVKLGRYPVTIRAEGYDPVDLNLEVKENEFADTGLIVLKRSSGTLRLSSEPAGQAFSLTGGLLESNERQGVTPADLNLPTGKYEITYARKGWPDVRQSVELERGEIGAVSGVFPQGGLELITEPAGLAFRLTGGGPVPFDQAGTTPVKLVLPPGSYAVSFTRDGWLPVQRQIEVKAGGNAKARAEFISGKMVLSSEPPAVDFVISASPTGQMRKQGRTPSELDLPAGRYEIKFQREGWLPVRREVDLAGGATMPLAVEFPAGTVKLKTEPEGLPFDVTGGPEGNLHRTGTTPETLTLPTGQYVITFRRDGGWLDQVQRVSLGKDQVAEQGAEFPSGRLRIESDPSGAEVWDNGKPLGKTPARVDNAVPGEHRVELKLSGYFPLRNAGLLKPNDEIHFTGQLEKMPPKPFTIAEIRLEMMYVPAGQFSMGSAEKTVSNSGSGQKALFALAPYLLLSPSLRKDTLGTHNIAVGEQPVTRVTISQPFWLGKTEVTQAQYAAIMGNNPSSFKGDSLPVEQVSWDDAMEFCRRLTERERSAGRLPEGCAYTLPTEAQWEYACRAGTTGDYANDLNAMGWYGQNSDNLPHQVGQKQANAWGLYDMHGNVCEWCADWYGIYPGGSVTDPARADKSGTDRVFRGGGWFNEATDCRSASRQRLEPDKRSNFLGFRLAVNSAP